MAARIVRNDFVAGEIDPSLWGRHDGEMFFHGASKIENFIPRKTGGVRKRAGTELLWHLAADVKQEYRIVPFSFDKENFGLVAFSRKRGTAGAVYAQFYAHKADGTSATTTRRAVSVFTLSATEGLDDLKYLQVGDTILFTYHGHRAFEAKITFPTQTGVAPIMVFSSIKNNIKPAAAPSLNAKPMNFQPEGNGYVASSRTYRLWGVKDGVLSEPTQTRADITLAWISGAFIDVTFQPDWTAHDYYILGKLQGGQYGEVTQFYPSRNAGARSDSSWSFPEGHASHTMTIDGVSYTVPTSASSWTATDTEVLDTNGRSATGKFADTIYCEYTKARTAPILSILLWVGVKATNETTDEVESVGYNGSVTAHFQYRNANEDIATWTISGQYGDSSHTLSIQTPAAATSNGVYTIYFTNANGEPVAIPVRGAILCSDSATMLFHDDNIQPGTLAGEQDAITVGDTGMDVDIINTWQQRLVAASAEQSPFTMWFSALGDLYNFYVNRPQTEDNAFEATIASTEANRILHIVSQKWLLAFTESGEYVIGSSGSSFAYNTISIKKTSSVGAHPDIVPTSTESDVLFVAADGRSVYKMDYSLERDAVTPSSVSTRAQHITEIHRIRKIAYQRFPDSVLWSLLDDGSLASMTFDPDENVCGWARQSLAGGAGLVVEDLFATGSIRADTDTDTTSDIILVLRDPERPGDVWIERLRPCVVADQPETLAAECIDHDGYGAADWPAGGDPAGEVEATLTTMRLDPEGTDMIGKQSNVYDSVLRIRRSGLVAVRPAESDLPWSGTVTQPDARPVEEGGTVSLVERDVKLLPRAFHNRQSRLEIRSADKWPCEILSMVAMIDFGTAKWGE